MKEYIIRHIDTSLSYDGAGVHIDLSLYPTLLEGIEELHDACVGNIPVYFLTREEWEELLKAKKSLEAIK